MPLRTRGIVATPWFAAGLVLVVVARVLAFMAEPGLAADVVTVGEAIGVILLLIGLLAEGGAARSPGGRMRSALDGLIVAGSGFYAVWLLFVESGQVVLPSAAVGMMVAVTAVVLGVGVVVAFQSSPPREPVIVMTFGVVAIAVGACVQRLVIGYEASWIGPCGVLVWLAGVLALVLSPGLVQEGAFLADWADRVSLPRLGTGLSMLPVAVALATMVYQLLAVGELSLNAAYAATAIAAALIARQALTMRDARRYAGELARMAYADPLTCLGNRRALLRTLHEGTEDELRTLLVLDLDGFKNINDARGHDVGDAVLVEVAHRLRTNLRPGDVSARLGGDEFAVLMRCGPDAAHVVANRLLRVLNTPYRITDLTVMLSASIGLAGCQTALDVPQLLRNADVALRSAKCGGKNRVQEYDHEYALQMARRTELADQLRGALARGELSLAYQPVFYLPDSRLVGAEALLRWNHPSLGAIAPSEFIPVAEESGLVEELGSWTLREACHQLSLWLRGGYDVWASVNLSIRQLHLPEFPAMLAELLDAYRLPGHRLTLEVAEHRVARDVRALADRLHDLRGMGVRVALDDFGTGYSSLAQLRTLPVDIVKIDKGLEPLADLVVQLGQRLGLEVIVEGIEEPTQLATMAAAGCQLGQGYLLARPMPAEDLENLLAQELETMLAKGLRPRGAFSSYVDHP